MNNELSPEKILKNKGCKLTQQRKAIIEVLSSGGHHTANEIYALVSDKYRGINFSTIYRNLELLVGLGIVERLNISDSCSHFELIKGKHHHHVICNKCGEVREIDICPFAAAEDREKLKELDFEATEHKFEIYGICSNCRHKE